MATITNVYEVNIRQYTSTGTIDAFSEHLPRLSEMGVEVLWLMPIFPISKTKRKGSLGSYYAPSDYKSIHSELGDIQSFRKLVTTAHGLGMKVLLDWMANHTGWDHIWLQEHPEFYHKDEAGQIREPYDKNGNPMGWSDVAHLNYQNEALWEAMIECMSYWVDTFHIDGFRQDMAMLVTDDFWKHAVPRLREKNPNLIFIAESEEESHISECGFNMHYGWKFHHLINEVARNEAEVHVLFDYLQVINSSLKHKLLFTSNHDENSWSGSEIKRMGEAYQCFAALTYLIGGVPLVYSGQEEPNPKTIAFFDKDDIGFKHFALHDFYKKLNMFFKNLQNESSKRYVRFELLNKSILYVHQISMQNEVHAYFNLSNQKCSCILPQKIGGYNALSGEIHNFDGGSEMALAPWNFLVLY